MKVKFVIIAVIFLSSIKLLADWGPFESMVYTNAATNIGNITAQCSGSISLISGDPAVTQKGVVWSTSTNPTILLTTKTQEGSGPGAGPSNASFTSTLTGLAQGTTYFVKAYATNADGTFYGEEVSFTTTTIVPTMTEWALIILGIGAAGLGGWFVVRRFV
ncbi:MAG: hypothetical protein QG635_1515 [Bacteroidota bacterium]|nr:hypothetical protein [Bacteroidota bacterium]